MNGSRYPGESAIVDGSEAIAHVETRISDGACAYPITPSTTMAAPYRAAVADGKTNLWGTPLRFLEPDSEHSSASAAEGFSLAGGRVYDRVIDVTAALSPTNERIPVPQLTATEPVPMIEEAVR